MKSNPTINYLILAAGYGTRLGAYGEKTPKGLIPYKEGTILDNLIGHILTLSTTHKITLVANSKFFPIFNHHIKQTYTHQSINLIDDGATHPDNRVGALGDIVYGVKQAHLKQNPLFVAASDTVFSFPLKKLIDLYNKHQTFITAVYQTKKSVIQNRLGCVTLEGDKVIDFKEKPTIPESNLAAIPFYIFTPQNLVQLEAFVQDNHAADAPGAFIPWLLEQKQPIHAYQTTGFTLDVGTISDIRLIGSN